VTDAASAQPICDATVIASEGTYSETLMAVPGVPCTFVGAYERVGTYVLRATRFGFVPQEVAGVRLVMGTGWCAHVSEVQVPISLTPEG
jgi:hypothetical protein